MQDEKEQSVAATRRRIKEKHEVEDRIEQHVVLKRMCEGDHLYVEDQPEGPSSDVYTWTAVLGTDKDKPERRVVGRDLKKMQTRHWIRYPKHMSPNPASRSAKYIITLISIPDTSK